MRNRCVYFFFIIFSTIFSVIFLMIYGLGGVPRLVKFIIYRIRIFSCCGFNNNLYSAIAFCLVPYFFLKRLVSVILLILYLLAVAEIFFIFCLSKSAKAALIWLLWAMISIFEVRVRILCGVFVKRPRSLTDLVR